MKEFAHGMYTAGEDTKINPYKKLCIEDDCYNIVKEDDIERNEEGRPYPRSQKCWTCRTSQDKAAIKKFRKKVNKIKNLNLTTSFEEAVAWLGKVVEG